MKLTKKIKMLLACLSCVAVGVVFIVLMVTQNKDNYRYLSFEQTSLSMLVGEECELNIKTNIGFEDVDYSVEQTGSVLDVQWTGEKFKITALGEGEAAINIKATFQNQNRSAKCVISVKDETVDNFTLDIVDVQGGEYKDGVLFYNNEKVIFKVVIKNNDTLQQDFNVESTSSNIKVENLIDYFRLTISDDGEVRIFDDDGLFDFHVPVKKFISN